MERESWHLDKRVPLALIFAIAAQTVVAVWFISALDQRVAVNENTIKTMTSVTERLVRTETKMEYIQETVSEIKQLLQRIYPYAQDRVQRQGPPR